MQYEFLIKLAETFSGHIGRSEATLSNKCVGHARLFSRLRDGCGCSVGTFNGTVLWLSENWPEDLEWPADVPRPFVTKDAA